MESSRQQKFARLLQKELAEIFQRQVTHLLPGGMISITAVRMSPDLSVARVYLSLLVAPDPAAAVALVNQHKSVIRRHLGLRIGKHARITPDLHFFLDDSASYASHIDQLLSGLDIKPAEEEEKQED
jgi:ribosome-binding factor A